MSILSRETLRNHSVPHFCEEGATTVATGPKTCHAEIHELLLVVVLR